MNTTIKTKRHYRNKKRRRCINRYMEYRIKLKEPFVCNLSFEGNNDDDSKFLRTDAETVVIPHHRLFSLLTKVKWEKNSPVDVTKVDFSTEMVGATSMIEYGGRNVEAFPAGETLWLRFGIPGSISNDEFNTLINDVGGYGMSHYSITGYQGIFDVEKVVEVDLGGHFPPEFKSTRREEDIKVE